MSKYDITEEISHYVDAILHTFSFPNRVNDIWGQIEKVVRSEGGDTSKENLQRLTSSVKKFLSENEFGHDEDYIYIIDKKGKNLKECGSLSAFEKKFNS
ncbi:hypothetical protein DYU05_15860 [Mucilaginibacter terrenus]|uniref:Uncharacterized protein n=1 Tax=Mucilaginibacter terrenus TaxID=2482727 RepID=A0A3E2NM82_9SPHI|nr:hypothetical protein [Mucilaginibacter terrenus]RFZ82099.1 hypothetical protein DYU05_15860 [Mucilaginibacter terrenus]